MFLGRKCPIPFQKNSKETFIIEINIPAHNETVQTTDKLDNLYRTKIGP